MAPNSLLIELPAESLAINAGSLLAIRGAILTNLRHMLNEVRDLIELGIPATPA